MKEILKKYRSSEKGFTLIELLVVVAILGILAAVIILNVVGMMNRGEEEARLTELHNLQTAVFAMMVKAETLQLDGEGFSGIDTLEEVNGVTATDDGTTYHLDEFLMGGRYPLKQAYDIGLDGQVSISE
jgi:prepilin-type N-terminal cleavage/methylation domain-containing protein